MTDQPPSTEPKLAPAAGQPVRIRTERFVLHSFAAADAPALAAWMRDARVAEAVGGWNGPPTDERVRRFIGGFDDVTRYLLAIREQDNGTLLGFYTLTIDPQHRNASLTMAVGEAAALRRAVAIETARALADWAFARRGVEKLVAQVAATNRIVADWLGSRMTLEGTLRDELRMPDGTRVTVLRFGLLKADWYALKRWSVENQRARHPDDIGETGR